MSIAVRGARIEAGRGAGGGASVLPSWGTALVTASRRSIPSAPPPVVITEPIPVDRMVPAAPVSVPVVRNPSGITVTRTLPTAPPPFVAIGEPIPNGVSVPSQPSATRRDLATPADFLPTATIYPHNLPRPMSMLIGNTNPIGNFGAQPIPGVTQGAGGGILTTIAQGAGQLLDIYGRARDMFGGGGGFGGMTNTVAVPSGGPYSGAGLFPAVGGAIGRVGAAIGKSKWIRGIVNGALVWALVDAAGNILRTSDRGPSRRMNVLNPKALRRADRRVCGFANYARKALRSYGYQVNTSRKLKTSCKGKKRGKC